MKWDNYEEWQRGDIDGAVVYNIGATSLSFIERQVTLTRTLPGSKGEDTHI